MLNSLTKTILLAPLAVTTSLQCDSITINSNKYDLTAIGSTVTVTTSTPNPPTTIKSVYSINLCNSLPTQNPITCPEGTRICSVQEVNREGKTPTLLSIIPIAASLSAAATNGTDWSLSLDGGKWNDINQMATIDMICDSEAVETVPTFISYENSELKLKWITKAACPLNSSSPPPTTPGPPKDDKSTPPSTSSFSFFGWFFTILFLAFILYLAIGSYHNYTTYGAVGFDMIPHKDMWRELPYLIKDLFRGGRRGGSGYTALG